MHALTDELQETMYRVFGEEGRRWVTRFPGILAECRERWQLTLGEPFSDLSINYVCRATMPGGEAVALKIGVPHREFFTEVEALELYQGQGIVRCLAADPQVGAMVIECVTPGDKLYSLCDNRREAAIAAGIMRELPRSCPVENNLPTFVEWITRAFTRYRTTHDLEHGPLGTLPECVERAIRHIEDTKQRDVLLHGDLHHANILYDEERGWMAIDPKGVIGDPCLETGRYLNNRLPDEMTLAEKQRLTEERIKIMSAELGESQERIATCAFIDTVLSLCWSLEDSYVTDDWLPGLEVAKMMGKMAEWL